MTRLSISTYMSFTRYIDNTAYDTVDILDIEPFGDKYILVLAGPNIDIQMYLQYDWQNDQNGTASLAVRFCRKDSPWGRRCGRPRGRVGHRASSCVSGRRG